MVEYMKRLAREYLSSTLRNAGERNANLYALSEELDRLDPRDFLPSVQYEFAHARIQLRRMMAQIEWRKTKTIGGDLLQGWELQKADELCVQFIECLEHYSGQGSAIVTRTFAFLSDPELRQIIERDYKEFSLILLPGGAWKSCVVLAGSILEAVLFDALSKDAATNAQALASVAAPKKKSGAVKPLDLWTLEELIDVAADMKVIPQQRANAIDQSLRDYRNFVHPTKEIRTGYPCTEAEAYLAKGALDSVLNHLTP